jgi:hypothetical protein
MAIGNLTSQIFANIYLNKFDRFVNHILKPQAYVRYGDDFILIEEKKERLIALKTAAIEFLKNHLKLAIHPACQKIFKAKHGLKFLGVIVRPWERLLNRRNLKRSRCQLSVRNAASYRGLMIKHGTTQEQKEFCWRICERLL